MKKVLLPILLVLVYSISLFSQWTVQTSGVSTRLYGVKAVDQNVIWACGSSGVVLRSVNGGTTWVTKTPTDATQRNYGMDAIDSLTAWVTSCDGSVNAKIWKTTDGGKTWVMQYASADNFGDAVKFYDANNGIGWFDPIPYPSTKWEILVTTNGGTLWTRVDNKNIPPADSVNSEYGAATALDILGTHAWFVGYTAVAGTPERVYHSTNRGLNWTVSTFPLAGGKSVGGYVAFSTTSRGCVVCTDGTSATTTDGGTTWKTYVTTGASFNSISSVPNVPDMYIAVGGSATPGQSYLSYDGGATWTAVTVPATVEFMRGVDTYGSTAFAVGNAGTIVKWSGPSLPVELTSFSASQNGQNVLLNWSTATETNNRGFEIERKIVTNDNTSEFATVGFKAGAGTTSEVKNYTYSDNVSLLKASAVTYRIKQVDFDGKSSYSKEVTVNLVAPVEYNLSQNYPNPFNPATVIKYSIANAGMVSLKIYNTMGQEVATLVNEAKEIGSYEVNFDAQKLSSGVYFYEINSGNFTSTKKMILMK